MSWISIKIISDLLAASNVVLAKAMLSHRVSDRRPYLLSVAIVSFPLAVLGLFYLTSVVPPSYALAALLAGLAHIMSGHFYYRAMSADQPSRLSLVFRFGPVFTLIFSAMFISERLTNSQYIGFGISFLGGLTLITERNGQSRGLDRSTCDALTTTLLGAARAVLTVYLLRQYPFWQAFVMIRVGAVIGTVLILGLQGTWNTSLILVNLPRRDSSILLGEQLIRLGSGLLHTWAIAQIDSATLVAVLSGFSPLYVWLIAAITRQENARESALKSRFLALILFLLGTYLMSK